MCCHHHTLSKLKIYCSGDRTIRAAKEHDASVGDPQRVVPGADGPGAGVARRTSVGGRHLPAAAREEGSVCRVSAAPSKRR